MEVDGGECGIFLQISRFNHACTSNAHLSWNSTIKRATIYAILEIPKNRQITVSYLNELQSYVTGIARRNLLHFNCNCTACRSDRAFGRESDIRRMSMLLLDRTIEEQASMDGAVLVHTSFYGNVWQMIDELILEGLIYPGLANLYGHLSLWHDKKRKATGKSSKCAGTYAHEAKLLAVLYARRALHFHTLATETESEATMETSRKVCEM